ncbi:MAG: hypothetical protein AB7U73_05520 [Pirellulales bacterium]
MSENPYRAPDGEPPPRHWWPIGWVRPTPQYTAGVIGGIGVGFLVLKGVEVVFGEIGVTTAILFGVPLLLFVGTSIAYRDQNPPKPPAPPESHE